MLNGIRLIMVYDWDAAAEATVARTPGPYSTKNRVTHQHPSTFFATLITLIIPAEFCGPHFEAFHQGAKKSHVWINNLISLTDISTCFHNIAFCIKSLLLLLEL